MLEWIDFAMRKSILAIVFVILLVGVVAAAGIVFLFPYQPTSPPPVNATGSTPPGIIEVVRGNNQFAFDLFSQLSKTESSNLFYSPYSISAAIGMTYEGAKGKTAEEMKSVFHFPESNVLRSNFAAIYNEINKKDKAYQLSTGNALWVQQDFPLLKEYTSTVENYYGGKTANVDFINATEQSRQTINQFIEEQTNQKIVDLIPDGGVNSLTRLVLTNAIYFKGTWQWQFDKSMTAPRDFTISPNNVVKVPMMGMKPQKATFNYFQDDFLQLIELPYKGDDISMLILLPAGDFSSIESSLTVEKLAEWKNEMKEEKMDSIYLPKFEFKTKYSMGDSLRAMGMPTAFSDGADFSGITGKKDLSISAVFHQAYIKVDEEGTEAAAATAVVIGTTTSARLTKDFIANHPFIFVIQEKKTGNILFMGKIVNPNQ